MLHADVCTTMKTNITLKLDRMASLEFHAAACIGHGGLHSDVLWN